MTGWTKEPFGERYTGEWLSFSIFRIDDLEPRYLFLTCRALDLDCIRLEETDMKEAKEEGRRLLFRMAKRYEGDLLEALRAPAPKET